MAHSKSGKVEEMFHPDARYLLLSSSFARMPGALPPTPPQARRALRRGGGGEMEVDVDLDELVGFASFRFDTEETMGSVDVEVVYWWVRRCSARQLPGPEEGKETKWRRRGYEEEREVTDAKPLTPATSSNSPPEREGAASAPSSWLNSRL